LITPLAVLLGVNLIGVGSVEGPAVVEGDGDADVGLGEAEDADGLGEDDAAVGVGEAVSPPIMVHEVPTTAHAVGAIGAPAVRDASNPITTLLPLASAVAHDGAPNLYPPATGALVAFQ